MALLKMIVKGTLVTVFLKNFRREHPHLKAILIEDGLSSTAPHIRTAIPAEGLAENAFSGSTKNLGFFGENRLSKPKKSTNEIPSSSGKNSSAGMPDIRMIEKFDLQYILGAKPGDHKFLFEQLETSQETIYHKITTDDGTHHQFRFLNKASLNKSNQDLKTNVIEYRQTNVKGKELSFSWVTNIHVSKTNILKITKGGRSRWKIENETFNTLKNLGYNFEHNYGHGKKYLSTILCLLMMLAFLIDQVQEICCSFSNSRLNFFV